MAIFRKRSTQSDFLDVFYCGHVTYQIWAWFETFKGNVNQTNAVNFEGRDTRCDKSLRHVAATGFCNKSPCVTCENHCRCDLSHEFKLV